MAPYSYSHNNSSSFASRLFLLLFYCFLLRPSLLFSNGGEGLRTPPTPDDRITFPVSGHFAPTRETDCVNTLAQRSSHSFPYFRDWKMDYGSDLRPKDMFYFNNVCWLRTDFAMVILSKTVGVTTFFLFAEGKAASPSVSKVLEAIPVGGKSNLENKRIGGTTSKEEAAVLHHMYTKFSDLTSRRDRCGCKPTKNDVKKCFILEFDREAFIIASTATKEEMLQWYRQHVVLTVEALKLNLLKKGILTRIYAPMKY